MAEAYRSGRSTRSPLAPCWRPHQEKGWGMAGSRFERFLALHHHASPLVMPNAWDIGSAKIFESLGFEALATTSSGFAGTLGRLDGGVGREEVLDHARAISDAVTVPVSGDLEDCFRQ